MKVMKKFKMLWTFFKYFDSSLRRYFLDTYSDIFVGGNTQKKVYLWTGEGDNGKSVTNHSSKKC